MLWGSWLICKAGPPFAEKLYGLGDVVVEENQVLF